MKLKHWQGYGCLLAKKLEECTDNNGNRIVSIKVIGNHEYGLTWGYKDPYRLASWLGRKSLGNFTENDIDNYTVIEGTEKRPYSSTDQRLVDTDFAIYTVICKK